METNDTLSWFVQVLWSTTNLVFNKIFLNKKTFPNTQNTPWRLLSKKRKSLRHFFTLKILSHRNPYRWLERIQSSLKKIPPHWFRTMTQNLQCEKLSQQSDEKRYPFTLTPWYQLELVSSEIGLFCRGLQLCVGVSWRRWILFTRKERLFDFAQYDNRMSFQNGAQVGLNTISCWCAGSSDFTRDQSKLVPWCAHLNKDQRTRTNRQSPFIHFCSYIRISNHVALYQNLDSILIRSLYTNITFKLFPKLENNSFFTKFLN